jgi:hypothetical protein
MLVMILAVLCSAMLLVTVIAVGKYMEQKHYSDSLQRSLDIYTLRSEKDWNRIITLLKENKAWRGCFEVAKSDAENQRRSMETYKALYRDSVKEAQELRDEKKALREQLANKTQECVVIARELDDYIAKFEGDM